VRDVFRTDVLRADVLRAIFRFVRRAGLLAAVFDRRALPWTAMKDFMTDSTAASAAAVAAAVAALTSICCTRSAPDLAAPTIVRRVFCTKLRLAMVFLPKGASAFDHAAPRSILAAFGVRAYECGNACFRSALFGKHWASRAFSNQQKENVRWQRKKPRNSTSYSTTR
jgi:hypothetical protein